MNKKNSCKGTFLKPGNTKSHKKSSDFSTNASSDINILALEAKMQSLQDHQHYLTVHYTNKIKALMAIMESQNKTKGELTRELRDLTHQLYHQKQYTQVLRVKIEQKSQFQLFHSSQLRNSEYYGEAPSFPQLSRQKSDGYTQQASRSRSSRRQDLNPERSPSFGRKQFCFNKKKNSQLLLVRSTELI